MTISIFSRAIDNVRNRPILTNTFGTLMVRGATTGTRLTASFIIAQAVAPATFGVLAFVLALAEIVKTIADLGVDTLAVRKLSIIRENEQNLFLREIALTKLMCSLFAYFVLVSTLLIFYRGALEAQSGIVIGLLVFTGLGSNLAIDYFQAHLRMNAIAFPIILINLCSIVIIYVLSIFRVNWIVLVTILPLSEAISAGILLTMLKRETGVVLSSVSFRSVMQLLWSSAPIAGTTILVIAYTRLDILFLRHLSDSAAVGYYGVAYRMTEPFQLVAASFALSIYSHLSKISSENPDQMRRTALRYATMMLIYSIVSSALLIVIAPYFIRLFLADYATSIPVLRVLALALIVRGLNVCLTAIIQARGHFSSITLVAFINLMIISSLLLIMVPRLGVIGAAIALLCGEIVNSLLQSSILWYKHRRII